MYKLEKLSDDKFKGNHPNFIKTGMYWVGRYIKKPIVGERFKFGTDKDHPREHLRTSLVKEVLENGVFKTTNSTYKLSKYES